MYHEFKGFKIPIEMIDKTGRGVDSWDNISRNHIRCIQRYCELNEDSHVLEIGCGVGRDAIPLTEILTGKGSYRGIDIMDDAITWCSENITKKLPNFTFEYLDIRSDDYNPDGKFTTTDFELPADSDKYDLIILQSVFTHLLEDEITHYMREFHRVLNADGVVYATCFFLDEGTHEMVKDHPRLKFENPYGDGCFVHDTGNPRRAVGYMDTARDRFLEASSMKLAQPIHRGRWSGRTENNHGQDVMIAGKS